MNESKNRLIFSRKLWGALVGSAFISLIVYLNTEHTVIAITTLGVLWGGAIAGQATADVIESKKVPKE